MSIVVKADELNTLIYKYLLQSGLNHTAYTLFNQAALVNPLHEFKFDIKPAHLLTIIQKALIFSQIEAHANFTQYEECKESFHLLRSHICSITEKIKQQKDQLMKQLQDNIADGIQRTNSIYHTLLKNKQYDDIVYEPKNTNYFDNFQKIKIPPIQNKNDQIKNRIQMKGWNNLIAFYDQIDNIIAILKKSQYAQQMIIQRIQPCIILGQIRKLQIFCLNSINLIYIYNNNKIVIINLQNGSYKTLEIQIKQIIINITYNQHFQHLIILQSQNYYQLININTNKIIIFGEGKLYHRMFDQYLLYQKKVNNCKLTLHSINNFESISLHYNTYQVQKNNIYYLQMQIDTIKISCNLSYISVSSFLNNCIYVFNQFYHNLQVYTFQQQQPIYMFNLHETDEELKNTIWINCKEAQYLVILTQEEIKLWEIQLNSFSKNIQIKNYDTSISNITSIIKCQNQAYLLAKGSEYILIYDVSSGKIQRLEIGIQVRQMQSLTNSIAYFRTLNQIYFLDWQQLDPMFK